MELFSLAAKLTLDATSFDKGIDNAEKTGNSLQKRLNKVVSVAKKLAGALVLKKAISSMKSLADAASSAGDAIDKNSQKLGMSRQGYQEWEYILSQSGASIDSLGTSMKTLRTQISNGSDAFAKLGLSLDDLNLMSQEEQFEAVVKALQQMPEGAEKSATAVELLGKNGQELMPLLNSAGSVDELRQKFHELGLELSDEQIDAAVKYGDEMDNLTRVLDGVKTEIGMAVLPMLSDLAEKGAAYAGKLLSAFKENGLQGVFDVLNTDLTALVANMRDSGNPVLSFLAGIIDGMRWTLETVASLFKDFDGTVKGMKESDSLPLQALGTALDVAKKILKWIVQNKMIVIGAISGILAAFAVTKLVGIVANLNPVLLIITGIGAAAALIIDNWDEIQKFFEDLWQAVSTVVSDAWDKVKKWWTNIRRSVEDAWDGIKDYFTRLWEGIKNAVVEAWDSVKKWWTGILFKIQTAWQNVANWINEKVWSPISKFFTDVWNTITQLWTGIKTSVENAWNEVSGWLYDNVWSPIKQKFTALWSVVQQLWTGIQTHIKNAWDKVKGILDPIIQPIKDLFQGVVNVVTGIWDVLSDIFGLKKHTIDIDVNYTEHNKPSDLNSHAGEYTYMNNDWGGSGSNDKTGRTSQMHAKGSWSIPYDDYLARLHRGEMVLTKSQARKYREGEGFDYRAFAAMVGYEVRRAISNIGVYMGSDKVADLTADRMNANISELNAAVLHGMGG